MQAIVDQIKAKAQELLAAGTVDRVLGWEAGELAYDRTPAVFGPAEALDGLKYDLFCAANLSKYLIAETKKEGKVLALLKPCDTYSFNQLLHEHRIRREGVYVLGIPCRGKIDVRKLAAMGMEGITGVEDDGTTLTVHTLYGGHTCPREEALLERCLCCKGKEHKAFDEVIADPEPYTEPDRDRFSMVSKLEAMSPQERFAFWQGELSKCIRCNACRNVCPACSCLNCVFDNPASGVSGKANVDPFEEQLFHIIRAFHVAGRCTDCGECSRVCPQGIPLHLLNRKFIQDINRFYGEYQAGADPDARGPLTSYTTGDVEPSVVSKGGAK